jgi:hypothetical protein
LSCNTVCIVLLCSITAPPLVLLYLLLSSSVTYFPLTLHCPLCDSYLTELANWLQW